MSLYRVPLLFVVAGSLHKSLTPPARPATQEDRVEPIGFVERAMSSALRLPVVNILTFQRAAVWVPVLIEAVVVLASKDLLPNTWNARALSTLANSTRHPVIAHKLSPMILIGAPLALAGAVFRASAFRALGRHFTFELTLKKDHSLITTYPYNVVRHPSYLGLSAAILGGVLALATPDGWVRAALLPWLVRGPVTVPKLFAASAAGLVVASYSLTVTMMKTRVFVEDAMLRKRFGAQWTE